MNASASTRIVAIAGGVALFLALAWGILLFRPQLQHVAKIKKAQAAASAQVGSMNATVSKLQGEVRQVPAATQEYAALSAALPNDPQVPAAIDQVNSASAASGFAVKSVNPTPPAANGAANSATVKAGGVRSLAVSISGTGTYSQTMAFMADLLSGPRIFEFTGVSFSSSQGGQGATAQDPQLASQLSAVMFFTGQPTP